MDPHAGKFRQLALNISHYRKLRGYTQQQLADKVHITRGHLSQIEAPNMIPSCSLATLFDIAEALEVEVKQFFDFHR